MSKRLQAMDYEMARAIAADAANRQMRKAGRTAWSAEDYDLACETWERLARSLPPTMPVIVTKL